MAGKVKNKDGESNYFIYDLNDLDSEEIRRKHFDMSDFKPPRISSFPPPSDNKYLDRILAIKNK